jgi:hypothetical protein
VPHYEELARYENYPETLMNDVPTKNAEKHDSYDMALLEE